MTKATAGAEDLLNEAVRLLQCLAARDMARAGMTQQAIAKFLKTAKADVGPMVQGIKRAKGES
jgi:transcriptional regulator